MKGKTMTTIAKLTKQQDGKLTGTLTTLALHAAKITSEPVDQANNEKAPVFRVLIGEVEIGAGWKKTSKTGKLYVAVKLNDPTFPQPIWCAPFRQDAGAQGRVLTSEPWRPRLLRSGPLSPQRPPKRNHQHQR